MFQINGEVIALYKFEVNGKLFAGTAVTDIKAMVTLTKPAGKDLEIHSAFECYTDAESGGSLEFEAKGRIYIQDDRRPTATELYDIVVFHANRVFDILVGNCMAEKINPPERPDVNILKEDLMEDIEEGIAAIYDEEEVGERD